MLIFDPKKAFSTEKPSDSDREDLQQNEAIFYKRMFRNYFIDCQIISDNYDTIKILRNNLIDLLASLVNHFNIIESAFPYLKELGEIYNGIKTSFLKQEVLENLGWKEVSIDPKKPNVKLTITILINLTIKNLT